MLGSPYSPALRAPIAASVAGKAAEMVTLLLLATLVPRLLGPADYGQFAVALAVVTIGSLAMTVGGPTLLARFVPAAAACDRAALARALSVRLAWGRAGQLAAVTVAAAALVAWDPSRFPPLRTALVVLALALNVAATLGLQAGLGLGRTGLWSARYPLQNAVLVVAAIVLHDMVGVSGAVAAITLAAAVALTLACVAARPVLRRPSARVELPAGALRFGVLQAASGALVQVAHRGGVVAVALLAGSSVQTGYAALAIGVGLALTYAVLQVFTVTLPRLVGQGAGHGVGESALRRIAAALLAALLPGCLAAALLLDATVPAVFGKSFAGAIPAFGPAVALVVLAPVNALALHVAALRLRPEATLWSALASTAAFTVAALVAVPMWGALGGSAATLAGVTAAALVSIRLLPGAVGVRLAATSLGGAAAVLVLALAA